MLKNLIDVQTCCDVTYQAHLNPFFQRIFAPKNESKENFVYN